MLDICISLRHTFHHSLFSSSSIQISRISSFVFFPFVDELQSNVPNENTLHTNKNKITIIITLPPFSNFSLFLSLFASDRFNHLEPSEPIVNNMNINFPITIHTSSLPTFLMYLHQLIFQFRKVYNVIDHISNLIFIINYRINNFHNVHCER